MKTLLNSVDKIIISRIENFNKKIHFIKINHQLKIEIMISKNEYKDEIYILQESFNELLKKIREHEEKIEYENDKVYSFLLNIFLKKIANMLISTIHGYDFQQESLAIADEFVESSILFADIVNFTKWSKELDPKELVLKLNFLFTQFDFSTEKFNIEKIKTIGDCYMAASNILNQDPHHADNIILFALEMQKILKEFNTIHDTNLSIRVGIHTGKVVAGVIGAKNFIYDVWGDAVNLASRMESSGIGNIIQISEYTYNAIKNPELKQFFKLRGTLKLKSGHLVKTYILEEIEYAMNILKL